MWGAETGSGGTRLLVASTELARIPSATEADRSDEVVTSIAAVVEAAGASE